MDTRRKRKGFCTHPTCSQRATLFCKHGDWCKAHHRNCTDLQTTGLPIDKPKVDPVDKWISFQLQLSNVTTVTAKMWQDQLNALINFTSLLEANTSKFVYAASEVRHWQLPPLVDSLQSDESLQCEWCRGCGVRMLKCRHLQGTGFLLSYWICEQCEENASDHAASFAPPESLVYRKRLRAALQDALNRNVQPQANPIPFDPEEFNRIRDRLGVESDPASKQQVGVNASGTYIVFQKLLAALHP